MADRYQLPIGVAEVNQDLRVVRLEEKPWLPIHVTLGILTLNLGILDKARGLGTRFNIMEVLISWMTKSKMKVVAYIVADLGSLWAKEMI